MPRHNHMTRDIKRKGECPACNRLHQQERSRKGHPMKQEFEAWNMLDGEGRPAGGYVRSTGLKIDWQNGPLGAPDDPDRQEPNGAFVETVIAAALQRIEHYNEGQFACAENSLAITKLEEALAALDQRTQRRIDSSVEGTHQGS